MTTSTELVASVEIAHEARTERVSSGAVDGPVLRVIPGDAVRVAALLGRDPQLARAMAFGALAGGASLVGLLGTHDGRSFVERAELLRDAHLDLIVALASDRRDVDGIVDLAEALRFGCADQHPLPHILVAADERVRDRIAAACPANTIEALPDVRMPAGREALVARLRAVRRRAQGDVVLRDEALEAAARAMAVEAKADVVVLDVTGGATSVIHARPDGVVLGIHERLGVGAAADRVVARAGLDRVRRWIPRAVEAPALLERVFNRARWPDAIPASVLALSLEMALAREAIAHALADAERAGASLEPAWAAPLIVLTGRLAQLPRAAQSLLVAIDVFGATGPTLISRAPSDALVAAGALAARGRVATLPTIDAIAIVAEMWPRRSAVVRVKDENGVVEERVARGSFLLVPTKGVVEIELPRTTVRPRAEHLELGVVIDARGRPLTLPPRDAERIPTLARWNAALDVLPAEAR
ncbi:MAG: hypothetical protein E6I44_13370 [Chloroflexi bacterium]|nr:MAG: hypothetical protein E6I44_13370 [Chloroflexota bacterium]